MEENIDNMWQALKIKDQYSDLLHHIMDQIFNANDGTNAFLIRECDKSWVKSKNITLPCAGVPCCYLLISDPHPHVTYIGYSSNLGERLNRHNTRCGGSSSTKDLRHKPWHIYSYITGFNSQEQAKNFEKAWHRAARQGMDADDLIRKAKMIIDNNANWGQLFIFKCGSLVTEMEVIDE
jgi:predicted GIY-YIG superfamily endonuclease